MVADERRSPVIAQAVETLTRAADFALPVWAWAAGPPLLWIGAAAVLAVTGSPHPWWDAAVALRPACTVAAMLYATNMVSTSLIGRHSPPDPVPASAADRAAQWRRVFGGTVLRLAAFGASAGLTVVVAALGVPEDRFSPSSRDVALTSATLAAVFFAAAASLLLRFAGPLGRRGAVVAAAALAVSLAAPHAIWSVGFNLTLLGQVAALWGPPAMASGVAAVLAYGVWMRRPSGPARPGTAPLLAALSATTLAAVLGSAVSGAWAVSQSPERWAEATPVSADASGRVQAWIAVSTRDGAPHARLTREGGAAVDLGRQVLSVSVSPDGSWVAAARRLPEVEMLPGSSRMLERFLDDRVEVCVGRVGEAPRTCSPSLRVLTRAIGAIPMAFHPTLPRLLAAGADQVWVADLANQVGWTQPIEGETLTEPCWAAEDRAVLSRGAGGSARVLRLPERRIEKVPRGPPCLVATASPPVKPPVPPALVPVTPGR